MKNNSNMKTNRTKCQAGDMILISSHFLRLDGHYAIITKIEEYFEKEFKVYFIMHNTLKSEWAYEDEIILVNPIKDNTN
jgi:hypothetical protein